MDEQSLLIRQGGHTTNRIPQQMNSNRSSNQGQGKAKGKNRPNPKKKAANKRASRPVKGQAQYAPTAEFMPMLGKEPRIRRVSRDSCVMAQEELIANVTGSVAFANTQFALNPGIAATFPWLSIEAQGWERYRFRKLLFHFTTATGSTTPGTVLLAPDYDAADAAPTSEQVAMTYRDRNFDVAWCKKFTVNCLPANMNGAYKEHFIRRQALPANQDIKTYDVGNLNVVTSGGTAVAWGKLWVEYEVEFFNPQLPPAGGASVLGGQITGGGVLSGANPLGTVPVPDVSDEGLSVSAASAVTISLPGTYQVTCVAGGTVHTAMALAATSGCTVSTIQAFLVNAAGTLSTTIFQVVTTAQNAVVTWSMTATTVTASVIYVASAPASSLVGP